MRKAYEVAIEGAVGVAGVIAAIKFGSTAIHDNHQAAAHTVETVVGEQDVPRNAQLAERASTEGSIALSSAIIGGVTLALAFSNFQSLRRSSPTDTQLPSPADTYTLPNSH